MMLLRRVLAMFALTLVLVMASGSALAEDMCVQLGVGDDAPSVCVPFP